MAKAGTTVVSEAHAVGPIVIDIDPRGKVTGNASEAGCILKGIAKPSVFPTITELDVTLLELPPIRLQSPDGQVAALPYILRGGTWISD